MKDKFLEWEERVFTAPYRWLVKKGIVVMLDMKNLIVVIQTFQVMTKEYPPHRTGLILLSSYYGLP